MTPREIAATLDADPIAGLTHHFDEYDCGGGALRLVVRGMLAFPDVTATVYLNHDNLGEVFAVCPGRMGIQAFRIEAETLRADLVEILAWSLNAVHPDPAAPETRAALRSPGLYGEVLRTHLEDRRPALAIFGDRYATLIAAIDAALETST